MKNSFVLLLVLFSSNYAFSQDEATRINESLGGTPEFLVRVMTPNFHSDFDLGDLRQSRNCLHPGQFISLDDDDNRYEILEYQEAGSSGGELRVRKIRSGSANTTRIRGYGVEVDSSQNTSFSIGVARVKDRMIDGRNRSSTGGFFTIRIVN